MVHSQTHGQALAAAVVLWEVAHVEVLRGDVHAGEVVGVAVGLEVTAAQEDVHLDASSFF